MKAYHCGAVVERLRRRSLDQKVSSSSPRLGLGISHSSSYSSVFVVVSYWIRCPTSYGPTTLNTYKLIKISKLMSRQGIELETFWSRELNVTQLGRNSSIQKMVLYRLDVTENKLVS